MGEQPPAAGIRLDAALRVVLLPTLLFLGIGFILLVVGDYLRVADIASAFGTLTAGAAAHLAYATLLLVFGVFLLPCAIRARRGSLGTRLPLVALIAAAGYLVAVGLSRLTGQVEWQSFLLIAAPILLVIAAAIFLYTPLVGSVVALVAVGILVAVEFGHPFFGSDQLSLLSAGYFGGGSAMEAVAFVIGGVGLLLHSVLAGKKYQVVSWVFFASGALLFSIGLAVFSIFAIQDASVDLSSGGLIGAWASLTVTARVLLVVGSLLAITAASLGYAHIARDLMAAAPRPAPAPSAPAPPAQASNPTPACRSCGVALRPGAAFCDKCGARVA